MSSLCQRIFLVAVAFCYLFLFAVFLDVTVTYLSMFIKQSEMLISYNYISCASCWSQCYTISALVI